MLRLVGGGTAGALGATAPLVAGNAAARRKVMARLNNAVVQQGDRLTLHVAENLTQARKIRVQDSQGLVWECVKRRPRYQRWTASTNEAGTGAVTVVVRRADGRVFRRRLDYEVSRPDTPLRVGGALIGMSAMPDEWGPKIAQVGGGVSARRIFADLGSGPSHQIKLVEEAHAAGMLPVLSYKVGGDVSGAIAGRFNAVAEQAAAKLASYGLPTAVTIWHEPYKDMSGDQYAALHRQLMPIFRRGEVRVGPILNGWLLDNQVPAFESFCPDEMFAYWDWFGIDTYEAGKVLPGQRVTAVSAYLRSRGFDMPIGVGEYNGYSAHSIAAAGEALLTTPNVWFGCLWNVTGGVGVELSGDRLEAFRATLRDPRARGPRPA